MIVTNEGISLQKGIGDLRANLQETPMNCGGEISNISEKMEGAFWAPGSLFRYFSGIV